VPSLALGSGEVTMLSLVSGYGAFANNGVLMSPSLIRRVSTNSGEVLYESKAEASEVVSPATAYLVTSMLEDVVNAGTAAQVRSLGFRLPAAGKTGTTNDYRDAWFIGYTPRLVAGVWVGYDQPRTIVRNGYAAQLAVPMWTRFMMAATRGAAAHRFRAPDTVVAVQICPLTGKVASDACRRDPQVALYTEHFAHGTAPHEYCLHNWHAGPALALAAASGTPSVTPGAVPAAVPAGQQQPAAVADATSAIATAPAEAEPPKKRGFWAKVFGRK
jgi:membrane carboxypeptidase/penicillin-binding protein